MKLIQVNRVGFEAAQAHFNALAQVFRPPDGKPLVRPLPGQAAFGCNHEAIGIGEERLSNQVFRDIRAIRVSGVNEVHAKLQRPLENALCFGGVLRVVPDALAGNPHCAEAHAVDD